MGRLHRRRKGLSMGDERTVVPCVPASDIVRMRLGGDPGSPLAPLSTRSFPMGNRDRPRKEPKKPKQPKKPTPAALA